MRLRRPAAHRRVQKGRIKSIKPQIKAALKLRAKQFDPQEFLANTGIGKTVIQYRPKQTVYSQGDPADAVFYIQRGKVRLSVVSKRGKEATLALLTAGDFLGEESITSDQPRRVTIATALNDCSVLKIERKEMLRALHAEHEFSDLFIAHLVERHNRTQSDLVDQLFNSSEKRLARALLLLSRFGKDGESEELIPSISQETLAEMVGTTRSRVNFFMNRFRKLGYIEYNAGLIVHSSLLGVVLHD